MADFDLTLICALNDSIFMTRSNKLKARSANSQNISSYPRWILHRYSLLLFIFLLLWFFFLKLIICILIHIRKYGRVSDKNFFTQPISGHKTNFFFVFCFGLTGNMKPAWEISNIMNFVKWFCNLAIQRLLFLLCPYLKSLILVYYSEHCGYCR